MVAAPKDRRPGFSRRRQYSAFIGYVLAVTGVIVGAALLMLSRLDPPAFAALRMAAATVTSPVSGAAGAVVNAIIGIPASIGEHWRVQGENQALRAQLARQDALLTRARVIAYDNGRLRRLLALRDRTAGVVVTARLVSSTASSGRRIALLNAGRWQGVTPGMPVTESAGLVGRVVETGPAVARVLLLTDPESLVPVRRTRDGVPAIAAGRGDGTLDVRSVSTNVRFARGDLFVTTGTGGLYAPGALVARATGGGEDSARAVPIAHPDSFDFAIVTRPFLAIGERPR